MSWCELVLWLVLLLSFEYGFDLFYLNGFDAV